MRKNYSGFYLALIKFYQQRCLDLWNKNELASLGLFQPWARRNFPDIAECVFDRSDYRKSIKVIFGEIK
jgi:hypothetical protein